MPTWSEIGSEIGSTLKPDGSIDIDGVRRKYLNIMHELTGRSVIIYSSAFVQANPQVPQFALIISEEDTHGMMEVVRGLPNGPLDLIIHSPGGSPFAAEGIVNYLRKKFTHIRAFVPHLAMSAAAMMVCGCDEIVMGKHSSLGPIDPQLLMNTQTGPRMVPAQSILDQFNMAKEQCKDPSQLGVWIPMLSQFGPDLLIQCSNIIEMSKEIVERWLNEYMFKGEEGAQDKAKQLSDWLGNHNEFRSHSRHISRDDLELRGFKIDYLENNQNLQDAVLSIYHCLSYSFSSNTLKLIENNLGKAFVKQMLIQQLKQS
jgi:hypothetical protein